MKSRILRRILFAVLALALLGVGGAAWLLTRSDALEQALLGQISNSLLTRGHITEIELSLWDDFPLISLSMERVWLAGSGSGGPGAGSFSGDTLLRADRLGLTLDALSLLAEEPRIEAIHVQGAHLVLAERSDGQWNTDVWKANEGEGLFTFQIDRLQLDDVHIQVAEAGVHIARGTCRGTLDEHELNAEVAAALTAQGIPMEVQFELKQSDDAWTCSNVEVAALGATATGTAAWDGQQPEVSLQVRDLDAQRIAAFTGLAYDEAFSVDGAFSGEVTWDGTLWKGQARPHRVQIELPKGLHPWWNEAPSESLTGNCSGTVWFRYSEADWRVDVPSLHVELPGLSATTEMSWTPQQMSLNGPLSAIPTCLSWCAPVPDFQWEAGQLNANVQARWKGELTDYTADCAFENTRGSWAGTPWAANGTARINRDEIEVLHSELHWSGSTWNASGKVNMPQDGAPIKGHVDAQSPHLVLDAASDEEGGPWWEALELPLGSQITADIAIDQLLHDGLNFTGLTARATLNPQRLELEGGAQAWEGELHAKGTARWTPQGGRLDMNYTAEGLNVHTLFKEFDNFGQTTLRSDHVNGILESKGTVDLEWDAQGSLLMDRIRWEGEQVLDHGKLVGVEALMSIPDYLSEHRMAAPLINPTDLRSKLHRIELQSVSSHMTYFENVFHIPLCEWTASDLHVSIEGMHALSGSIDYSVGIEIREWRENKLDDIGDVQDDGLGNSLFISIKGDTDTPEFSWDRQAQREHRRQEFQAERDRLKALWTKEEVD